MTRYRAIVTKMVERALAGDINILKMLLNVSDDVPEPPDGKTRIYRRSSKEEELIHNFAEIAKEFIAAEQQSGAENTDPAGR